MRIQSPSTLLPFVAILLVLPGCGRKGDPIPRPRSAPKACEVRWSDLRTLEIRVPSQDVHGEDLVGVERVRVYYLALGNVRPTQQEVLTRGEVVLERRRPDLPTPGGRFRLDLKEINRPTGWMVVSALRVGDVVGAPSEVLVWMNPAI